MANITQQKRSNPQFNVIADNLGEANRNWFDLSHDVKMTFSMGQLIPFLMLETLPGDKFELNCEAMYRFAPLYLPIMHRCDITLDYFYIPNRILWPEPNGWASFITQNGAVEWPWLNHPTSDLAPVDDPKAYYAAQYMGLPSALTGDLVDELLVKISALPLSAYLKVYDEYYRNTQIIEEKWFPLVAGDNTLSFFDAGPPVVNKGKVLRKLWNRDYFTAALPTPQVGEDILIPVVSGEFDVSGDNAAGPFRWRNQSDDTPHAAGDVFQSSSWGTGDNVLGSSIGSDQVYLDIQETAGTIRQFRLAARLLEFMEKLMRTGQRYNDFIKGWFRVDPDPGTIQRPVLIGQSKGRVVISEVLATAETVTVPVGGYAGQALGLESSERYSHFCTEHGWIMGIVSITPRTSYFQGMHRMWMRDTALDYAWEQFAGIGDQEITRGEVAFSYADYTANRNTVVFGYIPRYSEYRWQNDIVAGQMRNLWQSFHLARLFDQSVTGPAIPLNEEFVTCEPRVDDVFQVGAAQDHEIYAHMFNKVMVHRQLPKFGVPVL